MRRDRRCVTPWNTATREGEIAYTRSTLPMRIGKGEKLACHRARPLRPLRVVAPSLPPCARLSFLWDQRTMLYRGVFRILKRNPFCAIGSAYSRLTLERSNAFIHDRLSTMILASITWKGFSSFDLVIFLLSYFSFLKFNRWFCATFRYLESYTLDKKISRSLMSYLSFKTRNRIIYPSISFQQIDATLTVE